MIGFGMIGMIGNSFPLFIVSTVLWSLGEILAVTNNGVYIANNSPKNFRARISAVSNLTYALAMALGTSLVGKYIDYKGINEVWSLIFVVAGIGTVLMASLHFYNLRSAKSKIVQKIQANKSKSSKSLKSENNRSNNSSLQNKDKSKNN